MQGSVLDMICGCRSLKPKRRFQIHNDSCTHIRIQARLCRNGAVGLFVVFRSHRAVGIAHGVCFGEFRVRGAAIDDFSGEFIVARFVCHSDFVAGMQLRFDNEFRQLVFKIFLDGSFQWTGTELSVVAFLCDEVAGFVGYVERSRVPLPVC